MNLTRAEPKLVIASIRRLVSELMVGEDRIRRMRSRIVSATLRETNSWTRVGMRKMMRLSLIRSCLCKYIQFIVLKGTSRGSIIHTSAYPGHTPRLLAQI